MKKLILVFLLISMPVFAQEVMVDKDPPSCTKDCDWAVMYHGDKHGTYVVKVPKDKAKTAAEALVYAEKHKNDKGD